MTARTQYAKYFLQGNSTLVKLECFEILHPNFTKTYRVCRNCAFVTGLDVVHEDSTNQHYDYYPMDVKWSDSQDDLDNSVDVSLGDLGLVFPLEFDAIDAADGFGITPTVNLRLYRSDYLLAPMFGPANLEARDFVQTQEGCAFKAQAPQLWLSKTGEMFTVERFPMMGAFL